MEKVYTVSKNKTGSWLWLRSWTPYCKFRRSVTKAKLIIFFAAKDGEVVYSHGKQDLEPIVAQIISSLFQIHAQIEETRENH